MYESIKLLRPYFHSLREVQNNVSLDIKIPTNWNYEKTLSIYKLIQPKVQDKNERNVLISLVSSATPNGYAIVLQCANEIIRINKENEEKEKLFKEKVSELEKLFNVETLDNLKEIKFINVEQSDTTGIRLVEQGDDEGQPATSENEVETDSGN